MRHGLSDGLIGDLAHICAESKVGARINVDLVPVSPAAAGLPFGELGLEMALHRRRGLRIAFYGRPQIMNKVIKAMPCPVMVVGEITAENTGKVKMVDNSGKLYRIKKNRLGPF